MSRRTKQLAAFNVVLATMSMCHKSAITQRFDLVTIAVLYGSTTGIEEGLLVLH